MTNLKSYFTRAVAVIFQTTHRCRQPITSEMTIYVTRSAYMMWRQEWIIWRNIQHQRAFNLCISIECFPRGTLSRAFGGTAHDPDTHTASCGNEKKRLQLQAKAFSCNEFPLSLSSFSFGFPQHEPIYELLERFFLSFSLRLPVKKSWFAMERNLFRVKMANWFTGYKIFFRQ